VIDEMIHRFYNDLWNRWDDAAVDDLLTDDFVFRGSLGTERTGRTEWRRYRDTIRAGSADFHNQIITLITDTSSAAARLRYTELTRPLRRHPTNRTRVHLPRRSILHQRRQPAAVRLGTRRPHRSSSPAH
jgi:SnoaL-like domain